MCRFIPEYPQASPALLLRSGRHVALGYTVLEVWGVNHRLWLRSPDQKAAPGMDSKGPEPPPPHRRTTAHRWAMAEGHWPAGCCCPL